MGVETGTSSRAVPLAAPSAARREPVGRPSYADAVAALGSSQKPSAGVPLYLRYVNRPLGRRLAALAAVARLSPHQVTLLSAALTAIALTLTALVAPTASTCLAVLALLVLAYALDSADGQLARLTGASCRAGEWLDHVVDMARLPAFHLVLMISLYRFGGVDVAWSLVFLAFTVVASTRFFALILATQLSGGESSAGRDGGQVLRSVLHLPSDTGLLNLLVLLLVWPAVFLAVYCALLALNTVALAVTAVRKFRALQALEPSDHPGPDRAGLAWRGPA